MKYFIRPTFKQCTAEEMRCDWCKRTFFETVANSKRSLSHCCSRACSMKYMYYDKPESSYYQWKGQKVGNIALHQWVMKHLGKPEKCSECLTTKAKRFEWANISRQYKRDLSDWKRLCKKCHIRFDNVVEKSRITRQLLNTTREVRR